MHSLSPQQKLTISKLCLFCNNLYHQTNKHQRWSFLRLLPAKAYTVPTHFGTSDGTLFTLAPCGRWRLSKRWAPTADFSIMNLEDITAIRRGRNLAQKRPPAKAYIPVVLSACRIQVYTFGFVPHFFVRARLYCTTYRYPLIHHSKQIIFAVLIELILGKNRGTEFELYQYHADRQVHSSQQAGSRDSRRLNPACCWPLLWLFRSLPEHWWANWLLTYRYLRDLSLRSPKFETHRKTKFQMIREFHTVATPTFSNSSA